MIGETSVPESWNMSGEMFDRERHSQQCKLLVNPGTGESIINNGTQVLWNQASRITVIFCKFAAFSSCKAKLWPERFTAALGAGHELSNSSDPIFRRAWKARLAQPGDTGSIQSRQVASITTCKYV